MLQERPWILSIAFTLHLLVCPSAFAQSVEEATIRDAARVLDEVMAIPARQIPQQLLSEARGVVIVPGVVKGGFVVGVRHGTGVMLVKDDQGSWLPPSFVSLSGGSVGWQAGLQSTDVVLVFKTRKSVNAMLQGKFTIGLDAAAAAGPVGRNASAGTDPSLRAEVYSYSRSRGLFAGVSIDGSVLEVDHLAGMAYYRASNSNNPHYSPALPDSAVRLINRLSRYDGTQTGEQERQAKPDPHHNHLSRSSELVRRQLISSWSQLSTLLDEQWAAYLSLPPEVMKGQPVATDRLKLALQRYRAVATNSQYAALSTRHEFEATYGLLREFATLQARGEKRVSLPPPPAFTNAEIDHRNRY